MKKKFAMVLFLSILCCFMFSCGNNGKDQSVEGVDNGIELTLDNYQQYLSIRVGKVNGKNGHIFGVVEPLTQNYDFNDVKITVRATGEYPIIAGNYGIDENYTLRCLSRKHVSREVYDETLVLKLSIGGELIKDGTEIVYLKKPEDVIYSEINYVKYEAGDTFFDEITCDYEVIEISGTVSKT